MKKLLAVVNPKSGTGNQEQIPDLLDSVIDKSRFSVDVRVVQAEGDAYRFGREAVDNGYYGLVAIGGDGTVNGAASAVINTDVALAVVPCGSGNGLGRHLNIPMNVRKALSLINDDRVERFDYGTVNDRPFMCTCGMGFDARTGGQNLPVRGGSPMPAHEVLPPILKRHSRCMPTTSARTTL